MKALKKSLAVVISCLLVFGSLVCAVSAKTSAEADTHLQFDENGEFKILQIADIQDGWPLKTITKNLIRKSVETQDPDLIVLSGDNINTSAGESALLAPMAIAEFMNIFEEYGIPVAAVFGNHDAEGNVTRAAQIEMYEQYDCFIGCAGEDFGDYTCGTYYVPLYSSADANEMIFNLWMIDSGDYNKENDLGGYAAVTKAQVDWYVKTAAELEAANGRQVPSLMFQHIVVPEIFDALEEVEEGTEGAVQKNGKYYVLPEGAIGKLAETPCPPEYTNGEFDAVVKTGDVVGMFFGHDHVNTYELEYKGVRLCNTPGVGFASYNGVDNGARVITLYEDDLENFDTEVIRYLDLFEGDEAAIALFELNSDSTDFMTKIVAFFKYAMALVMSKIPVAY